jgi:hypothetical protein
MTISRDDIVKRVQAAGAFLRSSCPTPPVSPDDLVAAADAHELPIGAMNVANDPVARAIFIAAYCGEAKEALERGYDAVWNLFRIPEPLTAAQ